MTTRSALQTRVQNIVGRTDSSTDTLVQNALDDALVEISMRHYFRDMYSEEDKAILEDALYAVLPTNTHKVNKARVIDGTQSYELVLMEKDWIVERFPNITADSSGKMVFAYHDGDNLYVQPKPSDDYTIRVEVIKLMTALSGDSSEPEVNGIDRVIIAWAASYTFAAFEQYISADKWELRAERFLARAIIDDAKRIGEVRVMQMHGSGGSPIPPDYHLHPFYKGTRSGWMG